MNFDRFEFEQCLLNTWSRNDDLNYVLEALNDEDVSKENIRNLVIGIRAIQEYKFKKLWDMFGSGVSEGKIL